MKKFNKRKLFSAIFVLCLMIALVSSLSWAALASRAFTYTQKLTIASDHPTVFGAPIDIDGDRALIGAYFGNQGKGAAYYYEQINGQWIEKQMLIASDSEEGDMLGFPLEMDGNHALVSALGAGEQTDNGAVYAYERINGVWVEKQKLTPSGGIEYSEFGGWQIALYGDTAMIGYNGHGKDYVIVYEHENGQWVEKYTLESPNNPSGGVFRFGGHMVMSEDVAWIYDAGYKAILGYEKIGGVWTHTITLENDGYFFWENVWSEGDHLVAIGGTTEGRVAIVYHRTNGIWTRQPAIVPPEHPTLDSGWYWVDGDSDRLVLSGGFFSTDVTEEERFFLIYEYENNAWVEKQRVDVDVDSTPEDKMELVSALGGDTVMTWLFTEPLDEAVYVYTDPEWVPTATPTTPPPTLTNTPDAPPTLPPLTASPTPTHTPLPDGTVELLVNGGFESELNGWKLKNPTKDKVKCNKPEKLISLEGACVFQFKGGAGENSKLQQSVDLAVNPVAVGDTLTLDGAVWTKGSISSKVMIKVKYASLPTAKITLNVAGATAKQWTNFSALQPTLTLAIVDTPIAVKVQIKHSSASGKVRYDALSLMQQSNILPTLGLPQ